MQKFRAKQVGLVEVFKAKAVDNSGSEVNKAFLILSFTSNFTFNTTKHYFSTLLPVIKNRQ